VTGEPCRTIDYTTLYWLLPAVVLVIIGAAVASAVVNVPSLGWEDAPERASGTSRGVFCPAATHAASVD
jgi:hypothetical protein